MSKKKSEESGISMKLEELEDLIHESWKDVRTASESKENKILRKMEENQLHATSSLKNLFMDRLEEVKTRVVESQVIQKILVYKSEHNE